VHLKLDASGGIDAGAQARDLGQDTADIVILSAADTELAGFAAARAACKAGFPSVVLTNLLALQHPLSVDAYVERTLSDAKIVVLRMLGGEGYWPHGVASLRAHALARRIPFVCVTGELGFDPDLAARGTCDAAAAQTIWRYCMEGGADNLANALRYAAHLIGAGEMPPPPRPMPAAGFWPHEPPASTQPVVPILFYRALVAGFATAPIAALADALAARGLDPLPIYVTSLKDARSTEFLRAALAAHPPVAIVNATAFATAGAGDDPGLLAGFDCAVLQVALAGSTQAEWLASGRGLSPRDLAMHVVMPEVDGRIFANVVAFKEAPAGGHAPAASVPAPDRIAAAADLAAAWVRLRETPPGARRIALILANYPNRDGRLGNGVGLDTPESLAVVIGALAKAGYDIGTAPRTGATLIEHLAAGPTNARDGRAARTGGVTWPLAAYAAAFAKLPAPVQEAITARWGPPAADPHVVDGAFRLGFHAFGHLRIGVQPARGFDLDPKASYHDPDLVPPHNYLAFYLWLRTEGVHAVVHLGKHGNLEWLPGKSTGLSADCLPEAVLGRLPHLYPFIVNDPGEGMQAKRRAAAVIIDHLPPPLARAELHGELLRLEALIDEYALAADLDPKRAALLADEVLSLAQSQRLDADVGLPRDAPRAESLRALDAHLCDLKELQIRDGLHVFGRAPEAARCDELMVAIARLPRADARPADASLHRGLAADLGLGAFDPLTGDFAAPYDGPRPDALRAFDGLWRTAGDTVERIERLARDLVAGRRACPAPWTRTAAVLGWIDAVLRPRLMASGQAEIAGLLAGLDGRFVAPGPSGAPTRGRPDVLPTGRNFFAVDTRAVPTPSAWRIGSAAAERLIEAYWQAEGDWPRAVALSAWGTANMRTGGDDVAQMLALIGARPVWEPESGRVTGFEITPLADLGRPRVDVTFRVSGLFRDAFPTQMDLLASAVRAVAELDEPADANPLAARARADAAALLRAGASPEVAAAQAAYRVFGNRPGGYGSGLGPLLDQDRWQTRDDLAGAYLASGGHAYGAGADGAAADAAFRARLAGIDLVAQAQDNREHDILDSDDYHQFMGGLAATVESLRGRAPRVVHLDTSRPETPVARPLALEIGRIVRGRAANARWIAGVMRHGYKGAAEIAATVDCLFGFAASTDAVGSHHFDQLFAAYIEDATVRAFMAAANPEALRETAGRFAEALRRNLWQPRSNSAGALLEDMVAKPHAMAESLA
jgi:cobaltochelatase CobN